MGLTASSFIALAFSVICTALLSTFPGWHEEADSEGSDREVKPFPSRAVSYVALVCATVTFFMTLLSAFWQHLSSSAGGTFSSLLTYGVVSGHVGAAAMALGWVAAGLSMLTMVGLYVMIESIRILNHLIST